MIFVLMVVNLFIIALELYNAQLLLWTYHLRAIDSALLGVFTFEILVRMIGYRKDFWKFWHVFGLLFITYEVQLIPS